MTRNQFQKKVQSDFLWMGDTAIKKMLCGKKIGTGCSREVFECKIHTGFVIKVQYDSDFDNMIEYEIWDAIHMADWWSKWFAECLHISRSGKVLIQERVSFNKPKTQYPHKIPRFFTDIKTENYGFVGDQLKCVDYANVLGMLTGFMDKKMRRAKW